MKKMRKPRSVCYQAIEIIDISDFKLSDESFPMSKLVDSSDVRYIKLETRNESLLPMKTPYVSKVLVMGDDIYIRVYLYEKCLLHVLNRIV